MQSVNPGSASKPIMEREGQLENKSTTCKQHSAISWRRESWTRWAGRTAAQENNTLQSPRDPFCNRRGHCTAQYSELCTAPVPDSITNMDQSAPSLKWSVKGAKCYQVIFNTEKLGIFSLFFLSLFYYFLTLWPSFLLLADGWTVPWKHNNAITSGTKGWVHSFLPICFGRHFKGTVAR